MPTLDARPGRLDGVYRPGGTITATLSGPAGWLASRTFTGTFGGTAISVTENGDDLVVFVSAAVTSAHPTGAQQFILTQTGGNDEIVGSWVPRTSGSLHENTDAVVVIDDLNVEVSILGAGVVSPLPVAGDTGQVLAKASDDDYDVEWVDQTGGGGGGAPTDATYLTATSSSGLSDEVVVGATPGGELGGTWASPTVDATHSGSSHAGVQAAAEATAAAALTAHLNDTSDAHDASAISFSPTGSVASTDVQAAIAEVASEKLSQEEIEDLLGTSFLVAGTNVTLTYGDNGAGVGTLTIDAANGLTQEQAEDIAAALIDDNSDLDWTYDDGTASLVAVIKAGSVTNAMLAGSIDQSKVTSLVSDLAAKAPLASPALTGNPTAPTQSAGNNSTRIATTAYADAKVAESITNGVTGIAPSQDQVFDALALKAVDADVVHDTGDETIAGVKTFSSDPVIPDEAYGAGWNGSLEPPTKNAVYDKIETLGGGSVSDTAYDATSWNGETTTAPSKNAVRDKIEDILDGVTFTGDVSVPDEAYGVGWDGSLEVPTKNAVYDKIETVTAGGSVDDTAYDATSWNGETTTAPSKNAVRDKFELMAPLASPALTGTPTAPTPSQGDNDTSIATTAYVQTEAGLLIPKSIVDAAGDVIIGTADNTVARMAIGTAAGKAVVADPNDANKISVQYPHGVEAATRGTSGSLGSTLDRAQAQLASAAGGTSGTLTMERILLPKGLTLSSITYFSGTTALATGSNQWFGLFDSSRVPLRLTVDDTSTAWAANTAKTLALSSTFTTTYAGWYYLGCCVVASTVPDRIAITVTFTGPPRSTSPVVGGSSSTGLTNPASCPNPAGAITIGTIVRYGEVS